MMRVAEGHIPSYIKKNARLLERKSPKLCEIACREPHIAPDITIYTTRSSSFTMRYKNILVHSLYDPEKEAMRFVDAQDIAAGDRVVVYGFGLGYHLKHIVKRIGSSGKLFVLEANIDVFKAACAIMDLSDLLARNNVHIITGDTEEIVAMRFMSFVDRQLTVGSREMTKIVIHQASYRCLPPEFERFRNTFDLLLIERRAPEVFEKTNIENLRANIDTVLTAPGLQRFANHFANVPAFFVNAGPSLDTAVGVLKEYAAHALICCCDTAVPALLDYGIQPDFIITVDPQASSMKHFRGYCNADAYLVMTPTAAHRVVASYQGKKIIMLQKGHSITKPFEEFLSYKGYSTAGSSVSCMGLDFLIQMGCDPIVFVGMDYSFPGGKLYSSHIAETKKWYTGLHRCNTLESLHRNVIEGERCLLVYDKFGKHIPTHQTLYLYLKQIEHILEKHSTVTFYNYCTHGAFIEGAENIYLTEELSSLLPAAIDKTVAYREDELDVSVKEHILERLEA